MNNRILFTTVVAIIVTLILYLIVTTAIGPSPSPLETEDVYRYVDEEFGNVCYILEDRSTMSCLSMKEEDGR